MDARDHTELDFSAILHETIVNHICQLNQQDLTQTQIQWFIQAQSGLLKNGPFQLLKKKIIDQLQKSNPSDEDYGNSRDITYMLEQYENMFGGFETQYLRNKAFHTTSVSVESQSYDIGLMTSEQ